MKRQVPTERDIANMIATAFEHLPEPDAPRLSSIEQRLLEQPRLHNRTKKIWWWLAAVLVAGTASALWWSMEFDSGKKPATPLPSVNSPSMSPSNPEPSALPGRPEGSESTPTGESDRKNGPMIYQRER